MRVLIILESIPDYCELDRYISKYKLEPEDEFIVLSFCEQGYSVIEDVFNNKNISYWKKLDSSELLTRQAKEFGARASDWIVDIQGIVEKKLNILATRLGDINFTYPLWSILLRLDTIASEIKNKSPDLVIYIGPRSQGRVIHEISDCCDITCYIIPTRTLNEKRIPGYARIIGLWFQNLFTEVLTLVLTRFVFNRLESRKKLAKGMSYAVMAGFPNNWYRDKNGYTCYRFCGSVPKRLPEGSSGFLLFVARKNSAKLRSPIKIWAALNRLRKEELELPFDLVERYSKVASIIIAYGRSLWGAMMMPITQQLPGWRMSDIGCTVNVTKHLQRSLFRAALIDVPLAETTRQGTYRAAMKYNVQRVLYPIFELMEGRNATVGLHNSGATVIGQQHGPHGVCHRWRFDICQKLAHRFFPDSVPQHYAVEGLLAAQGLHEVGGVKEKLIYNVGASRIRKGLPIYNPDIPPKADAPLLVLGDMHNIDLTLSWCFRVLPELGYPVIFRPHPSRRTEVTIKLAQQSWNGMRLSNHLSLEDELNTLSPRLVLATFTGTTIELAYAGWPMAIIALDGKPNYNPILVDALASYLPVVADAVSIKKYIASLSGDVDFHAKISLLLHKCANRHIGLRGCESDLELTRLLTQQK